MVVRPKKRYVEVEAEPELPPEKIFEAVKERYVWLFGLMGLVEADLKLYKIRDKAVIRCRLESLPKLLFSTAMIKEVEGTPTAVRTIRVSGTIRSLKE